MGQHARLSASQTSMWTGCAGSLAMQDLVPEGEKNVSSTHAQEGTCAHALLERCLGEGCDAEFYEGRVIVILNEGTDQEGVSILKPHAKTPKDPNAIWFEVDEDMYEAVQVAIDYVRRRLSELFEHTDTVEAIKKGQLRLETKLAILVHREDSFGTGDIIIDQWPEFLENVDYKHGAGVTVEVEGNKQVKSYALGSAEIDGFDHEQYRSTIVQPRKAHSDGPVRSEDYSVQELKEFKAWLSEKADRVDEADALAHECGSTGEEMLIPDALMEQGYLCAGDHCRWCDAKYNSALDKACPAMRKVAEELAKADFDEPPEEGHVLEVPQSVEELGRLLKWVPVVDMYNRELEAQAQKLIMSGTHVPGRKVVQGKAGGGRKFIERFIDGNGETHEVTEEWLVNSLVNDYGADRAELYTEPALKTGPQIEKLVPKEHRKRYAADLLYMPEGKLTMVDENDPREAIDMNPANDFDDDPEE